MQIILQEDIEKLGTRGEVVSVKEGYARNFLLPRKLALEASPGNLKRLEKIRTTLAKRTSTEREQAQKQAELLKDVTLTFSRKAGENDQLFGSVTAGDIAEALAAQGFEIEKRRSNSPSPSKLWASTKSPPNWFTAWRRRSRSTFPAKGDATPPRGGMRVRRAKRAATFCGTPVFPAGIHSFSTRTPQHAVFQHLKKIHS